MLKVRLQEENVKLALRTTLNVTVAVSALLRRVAEAGTAVTACPGT